MYSRIAVVFTMVVGACSSDGTTSHLDIPPRQDNKFVEGEIPDPAEPFAAAAEDTKVTVTPDVTCYALPLDVGQVVNLDRDVRGKNIHDVGEAAAKKLSQNGFVVVEPGQKLQRFSSAYSMLEHNEVPLFITSDSVLHLYHLFFDQILKYLEVTEFKATLQRMLDALIKTSLSQSRGLNNETLQEAARRNVAYLSVAAKLLDPDFVVPSEAPEATEELALIETDKKKLAPSPLMNYDCPETCDPCGVMPGDVECQARGACTCEDYTQYSPRGHYTVSEDLKRYFKAMMWIGRVGFRARSDMETIQAVLLTDALNSADVDGEKAAKLWFRIYNVTGFLVGASDDLTFFEYQRAAISALGEAFDLGDLTAPDKLKALRAEIDKLRDPGILGGFLSVFLDETEHTKGLRLMGQRYAPDSYVLGQMVWDHVAPNIADPRAAEILSGCKRPEATCADMIDDLKLSNCFCFQAKDVAPELCRFMPKGLDVLATLGSEQALADLDSDKDYCGFEAQLGALKKEFSNYERDDWRQSVYWYWLDVLKTLLAKPGEGYPNWMRSEAWATKQQNTALTSWAQLRHDTILYVKQSYTPMSAGNAGPPPEAFGSVEPVPHFFARLKDLAVYTRAGLEHHDALPEGLGAQIDQLTDLLDDLTKIAVKHLEGKALDSSEIDVVRYMGDRFDGLILGLAKAVKVEEPKPQECVKEPQWCEEHNGIEGDDDPFKTSIVADVHTDGNTKQVLEVGSGYLDWIIVAREMPDGTIGVSVGPVFSYHEFGHPMNDRLTDEKWNLMLVDKAPARPAWIDRIRAK